MRAFAVTLSLVLASRAFAVDGVPAADTALFSDTGDNARIFDTGIVLLDTGIVPLDTSLTGPPDTDLLSGDTSADSAAVTDLITPLPTDSDGDVSPPPDTDGDTTPPPDTDVDTTPPPDTDVDTTPPPRRRTPTTTAAAAAVMAAAAATDARPPCCSRCSPSRGCAGAAERAGDAGRRAAPTPAAPCQSKPLSRAHRRKSRPSASKDGMTNTSSCRCQMS